MEETGIRINKYLAECGVCSRRGADELIAKGAVTVNGTVAEPGMKIVNGMEVAVNGRPVTGKDDKIYLAWS